MLQTLGGLVLTSKLKSQCWLQILPSQALQSTEETREPGWKLTCAGWPLKLGATSSVYGLHAMIESFESGRLARAAHHCTPVCRLSRPCTLEPLRSRSR